MWKLIALLVIGVCLGQDAESIDSSHVSVDERLPFLFYSVTLIVTTTVSTSTTTTLTTATTCTSMSSSTACSGKRRRRGISISDEEYLQDIMIQPSVVSRVEPTEAPVVLEEPTRQAREAFYYYDDFFHPFLMPTFTRLPAKKPHYNPTFRNRAPHHRVGSDVVQTSIYTPEERFFFSITTSTKTLFTSVSTTTVFSATITQILLCSLPTPFSSCPAVVG